MPTNDERLEVAAWLRDVADVVLPKSAHDDVLGFIVRSMHPSEAAKNCEVLCRLADLIEPELQACETCPQIGNRDSFIFHLLQAERHERTCELEPPRSGKRRCKRCGAFVSVDAVWDCCGVIPVRFCPNCEARVIE